MFNSLKFRTLLVLSMLIAGLAPTVISSFVVSQQAGGTMEEQAATTLLNDVRLRTAYMESYLSMVEMQNAVMATNASTARAMSEFNAAFNSLTGGWPAIEAREIAAMKGRVKQYYSQEFLPRTNGTVTFTADDLMPTTDAGIIAQAMFITDNENPVGEKHKLVDAGGATAYARSHANRHQDFVDFQQHFDYYDVFLIEPDNGTIVYSVFKEADFGTSLFNGPYRDSGLAEVTRRAVELEPGQHTIVDYSSYTPSYGAPALFVASPIHKGDQLIGVLAFQLPVGKLNTIAADSEALGDTAESMLVGTDGYMRSQSRHTKEQTILHTRIESDAVAKALAGEHGHMRNTDNGTDYITAYTPIETAGLSWALISRIEADEALTSVRELTRITLMVAAISVLGVAVFAYFLGRHLYQTLGGDPKEIVRIADRIAEGNLQDSADDNARIGAYANLVAMRSKLREVLSEADSVAKRVRTGADQLSEANSGLSKRTEQQAANLEETGASTEELTSTVKMNAENAKQANTLAIGTRERAISSGNVAGQAIGAMDEISSASEKIADIIGVIDEIAFQTNLLALNAAVEAARAGDQGRGFAVVASEVRQLAGRSATAAKEIKDLIEDSVSKVRDGTQLVTASGDELKLIVESVSQLTDLVGQITIASDEQATGIEQINQALVHMDSMTHQNATMVQEAANTSREMTEQALELSTHIGYFSSEEGAAESYGRRVALNTAKRQPSVVDNSGHKTKSLDQASNKPLEGAINSPTGPAVLPETLRGAQANDSTIQSPLNRNRVVGKEDTWDEF
jgi:methyl-accepting chemotaxis protein